MQKQFCMKHLIALFLLCTLALSGYAQVGAVEGSIRSEGGPLPYANVALENTTYGSYSDEEGAFTIQNVPAGAYTMVVTAVGFRHHRKQLQVAEGQIMRVESIQLQEDALGLEEVVVTGTMKETFVSASPVKIDVITARYLEKNIAPTNLVEGITLINGIQEVVACGVCFTNSISINGLPGPYTAILMDGTPMYGNLASVYGLNGIPTQMIDRFEVIKGPSSTLYGSEAVAGVINIITKDPAKQPWLSVDLMGTSHLESFGNITVAPQVGKLNGYVGLNYAYINDFDDENNDGFSDVANLDRLSLFTKWSLQRKSRKKATLAAKYYYEDRRNGVERFLQNRAYRTLRGSDEIYGESIYTRRGELFGTYELPTSEYFRLDYSLSHHDQNSYYGSDLYEAKQTIGYANLLWNKPVQQHDLTVGLTTRYQGYDDNTIATGDSVTNHPDNQWIPGVFAQDEWALSKRIVLLAGARLDHYGSHGPIFAPRLNVKYNPGEWTTLRANFGTGFRIVNLFTEDHAFVTGQRSVEILEDLLPERSYNGSLNLNHVYTLGNSQGMIDIDGFYTYFTNKIIPSYDDPTKIIYENSDGFAVSRGLGVNVTQQFAFPLSLNLGFNAQRVHQTEPNEAGQLETTAVEFAPRWTGVGTFNYEWKKPQLTFAYTLRLTGPMALPEVYDLDEQGTPRPYARPTQSAAFSFHTMQVTKVFGKNFQLYGGIQNVLNYRQDYSPLVGYNDPSTAPGFSSSFDTSYSFSPIHGREFYLGFRWSFDRK